MFQRCIKIVAASTVVLLVATLTANAKAPGAGAEFELLNADGNRVTQGTLAGKYSLVFLGYMHCPDICPMSLTKISSALHKLPSELVDQISPVFISIDPERSSSKMLKDYAKSFHPKLITLTGTPQQVKKAADHYRAFFSKQFSKDPDNYLINHTSLIYLVGADGEYITHFDASGTVEEITKELKAKIILK